MTSIQASRTGVADWESPGRPVVVGVDASWHNRAAIDWAAAEASATGRPLDLVVVLGQYDEAHHSPARVIQPGDWDSVDRLAETLRRTHPAMTIRRVISVGGPAPSLLARAATAAILVVGRRDPGTAARILLGATSWEVATGTDVPVVMVPDWWAPESEQGPVVLGVNPFEDHPAAMRFAFLQAARRGVELRVVAGLELPLPIAWQPIVAVDTYSELLPHATQELAATLAPYRRAFPSVTVTENVAEGHPADLLLHHADGAHLVVVGRGVRHGLPWGSVTRTLVHRSGLPLAVVPAPGGAG